MAPTSTDYDPTGLPRFETDEANRITERRYDNAGRLNYISDPSGRDDAVHCTTSSAM
ncbi:MAG: RHS repeat domain-containing protein [Anaerolineae bacterium]